MNKRILVIEDTEDNRRILRDLLSASGYEVIEATDGATGVSMAAEQHIAPGKRSPMTRRPCVSSTRRKRTNCWARNTAKGGKWRDFRHWRGWPGLHLCRSADASSACPLGGIRADEASALL